MLAELGKGPLADGFASDKEWTLDRTKTPIGKLFHAGCTAEGTSKLMRRHGWSAQVRCGKRWNSTTKLSRCGKPRWGQI